MTTQELVKLLKPTLNKRLIVSVGLAGGSLMHSYYTQKNKYELQLKEKPVPWQFHIAPVVGWTSFGFCLPQVALGVFLGLRTGEVVTNGCSAYYLWKEATIRELQLVDKKE